MASTVCKYLIVSLFSGLCYLFLGGQVFSASFVPDVYYANYRIQEDWEELLAILEDIEASTRVGADVDEEKFAELNQIFLQVFEYFPTSPSNNLIYRQCELSTQELAEQITNNKYGIFKDRCFTPLGDIIKDIQMNFTVKPRIKVRPNSGPAPLNVTLDARESVDPSNDTIPSDNFYWYYKDVYGDEQPIGRGPVLNYTFTEPGNHIVHLTVRSSNNATEGVFDGDSSVSVNVSPRSATMVVYVNGQQASNERLLKIGTQDAKNGILIDGTATRPVGARTIVEHNRQITSDQQYSFRQSGEGPPTQFIHRFPDNGVYTIVLEITDNEGNRLRESYLVSVSDPVSSFKIAPNKGNTSTTFTFDASPSYSITSRISTYQWLITGPDGEQFDVVQSKELKRKFLKPGTYTVKLTVTDESGSTSFDTQQLYVSSTPPVPSFFMEPQSQVRYPSKFIFDAQGTFDEDVRNGSDELQFRRLFSNNDFVTIERSFTDDDSKIRVTFDQPGEYKVKLLVEDSYGEMTEIEKDIMIESTLRPDIVISPQVSNRGEDVTFVAKVNKPVTFYERSFGDGQNQQSDTPKVTHAYTKAGTYEINLTVRAINGEENEVTKYVFMGQKDRPIPAYEVRSIGNIALRRAATCIDDEGNSIPAFQVERYENFVVNASSSVNAQGNTSNLAISFQPQNDEIYNKPIFNYNFLELGCWYIDLFVEDSNIGKTESTRIWFEVVNALPTLQNLVLHFPQAAGSDPIGVGLDTSSIDQELGVFGDPTVSSVVVKVSAQGARDPDGFISHYRWYYYPSEDPSRKEGFKITPADVPYATFVVPKPPYATEYAFAVDMVDNDDGKVSSETLIGKGPIIFFPPGENSLDVPIVTLTTNAVNAKVGDEITFTTKSSILSERPDFASTRYFKYDFDGDGIYDGPPTKKEIMVHEYGEPGEKRPKVAVFYRGRAGVGNSEPLIIRKGLRPLFLFDTYDTKVLVKDFSFGDIAVGRICLDEEVCGADEDQQTIITDEPFLYEYPTYGRYSATMSVVDSFGNDETTRQIIEVTEGSGDIGILSLPKGAYADNGVFEIPIGSNLDNTVSLYVDSEDNCYIDLDITSDSNGDGEPTIDEDIVCNELVTHTFFPNQEQVVGRLYYVVGGEIKELDIHFNFIDFEQVINEEYRRAFDEIEELLDNIPGGEEDDLLLFYKDLLLNLQAVLGEKDQMNSLIIQLRDLLADYPNIVDPNDKQLLETLLLGLSDSTVAEIYGGTTYETAKANIVVFFMGNSKAEVQELFGQFERANGNKEDMKSVLDGIFTIAAEERRIGEFDEVDFNYIKRNLCDIVEYYELPSKTCGTEIEEETVEQLQQPRERSMLSRILRVVLIIVLVLAVVFVGLIVVFAIKAKKQKQQQEEEGE